MSFPDFSKLFYDRENPLVELVPQRGMQAKPFRLQTPFWKIFQKGVFSFGALIDIDTKKRGSELC